MQPVFLFNGIHLDLVPTAVMRARSTAVQRQLSTHAWLLRRKSDGKYLACTSPGDRHAGWTWLSRPEARWLVEADALASQAREAHRKANRSHRLLAPAPGSSARNAHNSPLVDAIGPGYARRTGLDRVPEPGVLAYAGPDRYHRPLWLHAPAAGAWALMRAAAAGEAVALEAISGFRSREYQAGIFRRKIARGQSIDDILSVNAAPGFSEHHSGCALDIGTPGEPAAEETFEKTAAFEWLSDHAHRFGFAMSYPRGNPHGIAYEPWHWRWRACEAARQRPTAP